MLYEFRDYVRRLRAGENASPPSPLLRRPPLPPPRRMIPSPDFDPGHPKPQTMEGLRVYNALRRASTRTERTRIIETALENCHTEGDRAWLEGERWNGADRRELELMLDKSEEYGWSVRVFSDGRETVPLMTPTNNRRAILAGLRTGDRDLILFYEGKDPITVASVRYRDEGPAVFELSNLPHVPKEIDWLALKK